MYKLRTHNNKPQIWDFIRQRWVAFTQEEQVRQWLIQQLINKKIEPFRIGVEISLTNSMRNYRMDVVVYDRAQKPIMICECKAPNTKIDDATTFNQIFNYNNYLQVPYLLITNGTELICFKVDFLSRSHTILSTLPSI